MSAKTKEGLGSFINLQTRRFSEQVNEPLNSNCSIKLEFDQDKLIHARINTDEKLRLSQLNHLEHICHSWLLKEMEISRSGTGLKIEFNPDKK